MKLPLSCIAAFVFATPVLAQAPERVFPKVFMWQGKCYPSDCSTGSTVCFTSGPHFVQFMSVDVSQPGFDPEVAAINVANSTQANLPTPIGGDPMIQIWLAELPAADLNLDDAIDGIDLGAFLRSFEDSTP